MKKYENTNFRLSAPEIIGLIVFVCLLVATVFFYKSYSDVKELFNIEKTEVDYIIQAPSKEQVNEISNMGHVDKITPYYYRSVDVSAGRGNVSSHLFIVDDANDIQYTTLSDKLLEKKASQGSANKLYITDDFAKNSGISVGDTIQLAIDGTDVTFSIAGIFKSDHRHVGGTLIAVKTDDVEKAMKSLRYSGAFVASNNLTDSNNYFMNEYDPMGDMRSRDEFESDEAYQTYLDTRVQSDTTKEAFVTSDYIKELSRRNNGKLIRDMIISIACVILGYIIIALIMIMRTNNYTNTNVLRDIKDNFTIDQETHMYKKYFISFGSFLLLINAIIALIAHFVGWMNIVPVVNALQLSMTIVIFIVIGKFAIDKLKQRFMIENKKYQEEKRKAQEAAS